MPLERDSTSAKTITKYMTSVMRQKIHVITLRWVVFEALRRIAHEGEQCLRLRVLLKTTNQDEQTHNLLSHVFVLCNVLHKS